MPLSKDQQTEEIIKCYSDFPYFCEKYVQILVPRAVNHTSVLPFKLHDYQVRWAEFVQEHRFTIHSKFRQGGFTTLACIYGLWLCLFRCDQRVMYMAKTDREAIDACNRVVKRALEYLPDWMKGNVLKMTNDHQKNFPDTGSDMIFHTPEAACGKAMSLLIIDEASFFKNMESHWKAMWPVLSTGSSAIIMSTANSTEDWFWDKLLDAKLGLNDWGVYQCDLNEHPEYSSPTWQHDMKLQLGVKGWESEMLQEAHDSAKKVKEVKPKGIWRSIHDDWRGDKIEFDDTGLVS